MKTHIIQLENHDDLISVRDKLSWSKSPRILLVWPRRGRVLERQVDLFLLQRHAQSLGAQLGIVTADNEVRANAYEQGIPTFSTTLQAQRGSWRRPRGKRRLNWRNFRPRVDRDSLRAQRATVHPEVLESSWARIFAFAAGVLAVLALMMFFLPSAQVVLSPERQDQTLSLEGWASPQIREVNPSGGMPAFPISVVVEGSEQINSSGTIGIPDRQAEGEVLFTNLGEQEITIPTGSVVQTAGANVVRFRTTREVTLAAGAGQTVSAPVRAELPGSQGNVEANTIQAMEGPIGLEVLVSNPQALSGGGERISPAPSPEDYLAIETRLKENLRANALEDIQRQLAPDQRLIPGSLVISEVLAQTREPSDGQPADFARISQRVEYTAWYVAEEDLQAVARTALEVNRVEGFQPLPGSLKVEMTTEGELDDTGVVRWQMRVSRRLESSWSNEQAARALVGLSLEEAERRLRAMVPLSAQPEVHLNPPWWVRMPFLSFRIEVISQ